VAWNFDLFTLSFFDNALLGSIVPVIEEKLIAAFSIILPFSNSVLTPPPSS